MVPESSVWFVAVAAAIVFATQDVASGLLLLLGSLLFTQVPPRGECCATETKNSDPRGRAHSFVEGVFGWQRRVRPLDVWSGMGISLLDQAEGFYFPSSLNGETSLQRNCFDGFGAGHEETTKRECERERRGREREK